MCNSLYCTLRSHSKFSIFFSFSCYFLFSFSLVLYLWHIQIKVLAPTNLTSCFLFGFGFGFGFCFCLIYTSAHMWHCFNPLQKCFRVRWSININIIFFVDEVVKEQKTMEKKKFDETSRKTTPAIFMAKKIILKNIHGIYLIKLVVLQSYVNTTFGYSRSTIYIAQGYDQLKLLNPLFYFAILTLILFTLSLG